MITSATDGLMRYRENRNLSLTKFLPSMYEATETQQFVQFFEDFLNTLFDGHDGMSVSAIDITPVSGTYSLSAVNNTGRLSGDILIPYQYYIPLTTSAVSATTNNIERVQVTSASTDKISILEKVYRLTELKDPDLIDIDYIQYFAANMGYNINVYRPEVGNVGAELGLRTSANPATSASDVNSYLRFMVSNLPNWYKIKSTSSAVRVMLYSFGLVGDLVNFYTSNYFEPSDGGQWVVDVNNDLSNIPKSYFLTPHFGLLIDIDASEDLIADIEKRSSIIRAINSIRPINSVFRSLIGHATRNFHMNIRMHTRLSRYIRIEDNIPIADFTWTTEA